MLFPKNVAFLLKGLSNGMLFNAIITSTKYFDEKFKVDHKNYENEFTFAFLMFNCFGCLFYVYHLRQTSYNQNHEQREEEYENPAMKEARRKRNGKYIVIAFYVISICVYLFLTLNLLENFYLFVCIICAMGFSASLFQQQAFSDASKIGGTAMLSFTVAFSISGVVISSLSFSSYPKINFHASLIVLTFSFISYLFIENRKFALQKNGELIVTEVTMGAPSTSNSLEQQIEEEEHLLIDETSHDVETKTRDANLNYLSIFICFTATLCFFPGTLTHAKSSRIPDLVEISFLCFNVGDGIGRLLSGLFVHQCFASKSLFYFTALRSVSVVFLIVFLANNKNGFENDGQVQTFIALVLLQGILNGMIYSTSCMFLSVNDKERGYLIAIVTLFSLSFGSLLGLIINSVFFL